MTFLDTWVLTLITFTPLIGSIVVMLIPATNTALIKRFSVIWSLIPLVLSIWLAADYWLKFLARGQAVMAY
ncbi:MAG: hypothetical protein RMN24_15125, partial [Anaerolineae bacterium]|nr:hypothetical protein [Anaerolineae bacterium]